MFKIVESILRENPCYKANRTITVKGLMLHSVGCAQPSAQVFIKKWNLATYTSACVHGFIDANDGTVYQTLPWNHRGWHAGSGKNGSANNTHIGVEMCEPANIKYSTGANFTFTDANKEKVLAAVKNTYDSAVLLFAKLCDEYNLDPLKDGVIISHSEGYTRGLASGHADPEHLWKQTGIGYTMDGFRKDVAAAMESSATTDEEVSTPATSDNAAASSATEVRKLYRVRKSADDAKSQLGAYEKLSNAKAVCDVNPGFYVFDWDFKVVYPTVEVPFRFQVKSSETPLAIYKTPSKKAVTWAAKVTTGIYTIVKIQNGSDSVKGYGLLKAYSNNQNGWVNLDDVKTIL